MAHIWISLATHTEMRACAREWERERARDQWKEWEWKGEEHRHLIRLIPMHCRIRSPTHTALTELIDHRTNGARWCGWNPVAGGCIYTCHVWHTNILAIYVQTCMYFLVCIRTFIRTYLRVNFLPINTCNIYTHMHTCMHAFMHTYTHTYIHTHLLIYKRKYKDSFECVKLLSHICDMRQRRDGNGGNTLQISHVPRMIESNPIYDRVLSRMLMSHVTHVNESCHSIVMRNGEDRFKWGTSHIRMRLISYMTIRINANLQMSHVPHMNKLYFIYECTNESSHTSEWVMSHMWQSHVTASWWEWARTDLDGASSRAAIAPCWKGVSIHYNAL